MSAMTRTLAVLAMSGVLLLTGCAPDIEEAYDRCVYAGTWSIPKDATTKEYVELAAPVATACLEASKADPWAFNKRWMDDSPITSE